MVDDEVEVSKAWLAAKVKYFSHREKLLNFFLGQ